METRLLIIFLILGISALIYPTSAFACSLVFDINFLTPWNKNRPLAQLQRKPSVLINSNSLSMVSQQTLASIVF